MGSRGRGLPLEPAQWHCDQLCQELLAQDEVVDVGGGGGDGGLRVRDGRGQGWGVRLPDGPGLLRQEVRLHVRWGQSGMYGLKALQADGLVAQKKEVKPAVQMRNSVDTYYRNVFQPPPPPPTPSTG